MDPTGVDRLARAIGAAGTRRTALGALLSSLLTPYAFRDEAAAKRNGGSRGVAAQRKRRKRKKKAPPCVPNCNRRVCGPDGCGGTCGECQSPTTCDAEGRCVGCSSPVDCAPIPCREAACSTGVCVYESSANGTGCGSGRTCCGGGCVDTRRDSDNCGECGRVCSPGEACFAGRCIRGCDVCASGCPFTSVRAAINAAPSGGTVRICPGFYTGFVVITKDLTLVGMGDDPASTVLTFPTGPVVSINPTMTVTIRNLTITGTVEGIFAGILSFGDLTLERTHVVGNRGSGAGGIASGGSALVMIDSVVRDNRSDDIGGGILSQGGSFTLIRSRVESNRAVVGGGIAALSIALSLTEGSVVTGNTATGARGVFGGGIAISNVNLSIDPSSSIDGNTPDNCANYDDGTSCTV